jgi:hypothetical protein
MEALMEVSVEKKKTFLEKMEATDLEANPEEIEYEVVPKGASKE